MEFSVPSEIPSATWWQGALLALLPGAERDGSNLCYQIHGIFSASPCGLLFHFYVDFPFKSWFFASQAPGKAVTATRGGEAASVPSKCILSKINNKTKLQGKQIEGIKDFNK